MLSGPQRKFCEGIAAAISQTEAYKAAYPNAAPKSAEANTTRLMRNDEVAAEIARLRKEASEKPGYVTLTIAQKRDFLARVIQTPVGDVDHTSDLCQERTYIVGQDEDSVKIKLPDKLKAIQIDNDLSGDGAEAEGNKALAGMLGLVGRLRK